MCLTQLCPLPTSVIVLGDNMAGGRGGGDGGASGVLPRERPCSHWAWISDSDLPWFCRGNSGQVYREAKESVYSGHPQR